MAGDQNRRMFQRRQLLESLDNHMAGICFVIGFDLFGGEWSRAGHEAMPVIGLRRAIRWNLLPRLSPGRGIKAVGVSDTADVRESAVKHKMSWCVRAGLEITLDHFARIE